MNIRASKAQKSKCAMYVHNEQKSIQNKAEWLLRSSKKWHCNRCERAELYLDYERLMISTLKFLPDIKSHREARNPKKVLA